MHEPVPGPSRSGSVVLDLGPGIGALILYTPADLDGEEIEISCDEPGARRTHSQVRPRQMPGETRYAAVYPSLPAGRYTIWRDEHGPAAAVTVTGGQVSSCRWPG